MSEESKSSPNPPSPPLIRALPTYSQHPNGCGLASLLMLVDPPNKKPLIDFLSTGWDHLDGLFTQPNVKSEDLHWAIVLQYILLKSVGTNNNEEITTFFKNRLEFLIEDQHVLNRYTHEQYYQELAEKGKNHEAELFLHYLESVDYITPVVLYKNLHTMKTDIELKILAEIFNYEFLYQNSEDYTGAIYFTQNELRKKISQPAKVKWKQIEQFSNDPEIIILYGQYHHWLAVRGIYRNPPRRPTNIAFSKELEKITASANSTQAEIQKLSELPPASDEVPPIPDDSVKKEKKEEIMDSVDQIFEDEQDYWHYKDMIIDVNDPAINSRVQLHFGQLNEGDRFYIFRKRSNVDYSIFPQLLNRVIADVPEEKRRWQKFQDTRFESQKSIPNPPEKKKKSG